MRPLAKKWGLASAVVWGMFANVFPAVVFAQSFTNVQGLGLPSVVESSVAWGDFNNDGLLDLVLIGTQDTVGGAVMDNSKNIARIYRNEGNGSFTDIQAGLMPMAVGAAAWADFDNDGFLDLVIGGLDSSGTGRTILYRNNGNGTFSEVPGTPFHSAAYGNLAWGDFNNDGYADLVISAFETGGAITKLYRNNKNGTFSEVTSAVFTGANGHSKVIFGDYDNDGFADVLLCGRTTTDWADPQSKTLLYHNNRGNGTFTEDSSAHLVGVSRGSIAFGDFNKDGFLDILVTGLVGPATGPPPLRDTAVVYLNHHGDGTFLPVTGPTGFGHMNQSNIALGDYDGDGILDVLVSGYGSNAGLYKGLGDGTFTNEPLGPPEVADGGVAWGDFNSDGFLDALVTGTEVNVTQDTTILYRNTGPGTSNTAPYTPNVRPSAPSGLTATVLDSSSVRLTWHRGADAKTPAPGLSHSLRVGTTHGGDDVVSSLADSSGYRRIAAMGSKGQDTSWVLMHLAKGTYYWSVQAIDNGYAGSAFATEQSFTIGAAESVHVAVSADSLAFGSVMVGDSATDSLMVRNLGTDSVLVRLVLAGSTSFRVASDSVHLRAGDSARVVVTYRPSDSVRSSGSLQMTLVPSGPPDSVSLTGQGFFLRVRQVRAMAPGNTVAFLATVTRAHGSHVFLQDTSAGLMLSAPSGPLKDSVSAGKVGEGTVLRVIGRTSNRGNVLQIDSTDLTSWAPVGRDTTVLPLTVSIGDLAAHGEDFESRLVHLENLRMWHSTDSLFRPSTVYAVSDAGDTTGRVAVGIGSAAETFAAGSRQPAGLFAFTGVVGQADTGTGTGGYRLLPIDSTDIRPVIIVAVGNQDPLALPTTFVLSQNYPNPFNPETVIRYAVPHATHVTVEVYNVLGQRVVTLVDRDQLRGEYSVRFNGGGIASGVYFYRLSTPEKTMLKKMLLLK